MSAEMLSKLRAQHPELVSNVDVPAGLKMRVADGAEVPVLQSVEIRFRFSRTSFAKQFLVLPSAQNTILGWPFFC